LDRIHLVFRLDRETSGVAVLAKDPATAGMLQKAMQKRRVRKTYLGILTGEISEAVTVDQPLGDDAASPVSIKSAVRPDGRPARTHFAPLASAGGFSLVRVELESGRKHQIRAHAQWLGHAVVGDKLYGPDPMLYLDFVRGGWTPALEQRLLIPRQALHCWKIGFGLQGWPEFTAPWPEDLRRFGQGHGLPGPP
jgi:23S rRNA pseudouridine1911/1915/1917 synthase